MERHYLISGGSRQAPGCCWRPQSASGPASTCLPRPPLDRRSEAPDASLCPSKLGSRKASYPGVDAGKQKLRYSQTCLCNGSCWFAGGCSRVHLEGLVRTQRAAIHVKDRVLEAGRGCHPSFPGPLRAGLLTTGQVGPGGL